MTDVHLLGEIGAGKIHDDRSGTVGRLDPKAVAVGFR